MIENYLLINNGHGRNVCPINDKKIPWDLSDETKFTEELLSKHLENYVEMVDRIFMRIEKDDNVINCLGMFGREISIVEKIFIERVFKESNHFINNERKILKFVYN
ncbi:MAG: hypothetical protein NTX91_04140 [candidate division SR1 bacterium]|nr:hypothetical protein [candidate division SR1 bacterium]